MSGVNVEKIPRKILERAVTLRDPYRDIYLVLYELARPSTAREVAQQVGHARAYVHMRLLELKERGLVKVSYEERTAKFEVIGGQTIC